MTDILMASDAKPKTIRCRRRDAAASDVGQVAAGGVTPAATLWQPASAADRSNTTKRRITNDGWRGFFPPQDTALIDKARGRGKLSVGELEDLSWLSDVCNAKWCRREARTPADAARLNASEPWCPGICAVLMRIEQGNSL